MRARLIDSRLYYGWVIVLTLSITQLASWGALYYSFGVVMPVMEHELGWSRITLIGGFSLALLISGIAVVPVGHWLDRHGTRVLMAVGSIADLSCAVQTPVFAIYLLYRQFPLQTSVKM